MAASPPAPRPCGLWLLLLGACATQTTGGPPLAHAFAPLAGPPTLVVTSTSLDEDHRLREAQVMDAFGCAGGNKSPQLSWRGAPAGTRSYAISMHDPDAPTGVGFFHWVVADLPAAMTSLAEGAVLAPPARLGLADTARPAYAGACPPPGPAHRYVITVFALDVPSLPLDPPYTGAVLHFMARGHTLAYGRLTATYRRPAAVVSSSHHVTAGPESRAASPS